MDYLQYLLINSSVNSFIFIFLCLSSIFLKEVNLVSTFILSICFRIFIVLPILIDRLSKLYFLIAIPLSSLAFSSFISSNLSASAKHLFASCLVIFVFVSFIFLFVFLIFISLSHPLTTGL